MKDLNTKKKKWKKYFTRAFFILMMIILLYGFSLYIRRDALLKELIEKQVADRYPSIHFELGSASFIYGKGISLKDLKGGEASSPSNPIGIVEDLFIECPITFSNLLRRNIQPVSLRINGIVLHLPSPELLKGFHLQFQKKISEKVKIPIEMINFQLVFLPERGKKNPVISHKIDIQIDPPGSSDERGLTVKILKIRARSSDPRIPEYNGPISKNFDDWLLKNVLK